MLTDNDKAKFLYETKALLPYKRKEMALEFILKAKALFEQELIIDAMYNQMDYKTMDNLTKTKYKGTINDLEKVINRFE